VILRFDSNQTFRLEDSRAAMTIYDTSTFQDSPSPNPDLSHFGGKTCANEGNAPVEIGTQ